MAIVSLIAHDNWLFIWLITGVVSLVVMGAPQVVETVGWLRRRRFAPATMASFKAT